MDLQTICIKKFPFSSDYQSDYNEIFKLCCQFGSINEIKIQKDKSLVLVEFGNKDDANVARSKLNQMKLSDTQLFVDFHSDVKTDEKKQIIIQKQRNQSQSILQYIQPRFSIGTNNNFQFQTVKFNESPSNFQIAQTAQVQLQQLQPIGISLSQTSPGALFNNIQSTGSIRNNLGINVKIEENAQMKYQQQQLMKFQNNQEENNLSKQELLEKVTLLEKEVQKKQEQQNIKKALLNIQVHKKFHKILKKAHEDHLKSKNDHTTHALYKIHVKHIKESLQEHGIAHHQHENLLSNQNLIKSYNINEYSIPQKGRNSKIQQKSKIASKIEKKNNSHKRSRSKSRSNNKSNSQSKSKFKKRSRSKSNNQNRKKTKKKQNSSNIHTKNRESHSRSRSKSNKKHSSNLFQQQQQQPEQFPNIHNFFDQNNSFLAMNPQQYNQGINQPTAMFLSQPFNQQFILSQQDLLDKNIQFQNMLLQAQYPGIQHQLNQKNLENQLKIQDQSDIIQREKNNINVVKKEDSNQNQQIYQQNNDQQKMLLEAQQFYIKQNQFQYQSQQLQQNQQNVQGEIKDQKFMNQNLNNIINSKSNYLLNSNIDQQKYQISQQLNKNNFSDQNPILDDKINVKEQEQESNNRVGQEQQNNLDNDFLKEKKMKKLLNQILKGEKKII